MITLEIQTDNAAFATSPESEVARILRELADKVETRGLDDYPAKDANGNTVGWLKEEPNQ